MNNDKQNNTCGNDKLVALEEPEELRKLREENEELKKVAPASQAIKTTIEEETSCTASKYFYCHALLSPGEVALIRAIRKAEIAYAWERNAAILVDKESFEARRDFIAFITCGSSDNDDDKIRAALNKISREQEQEVSND